MLEQQANENLIKLGVSKMLEFANTQNLITLNIKILDYSQEYDPKDHSDYEDWLDLELELIQEEKQFRSTFPCLEVWHLVSLYKWFKALSEEKIPNSTIIYFLETNLAFEVSGLSEDMVTIHVLLDAEWKPDIKIEQLGPEYYNEDCKNIAAYKEQQKEFNKGIGFSDDEFPLEDSSSSIMFLLSKSDFNRILKGLDSAIKKYPSRKTT